MRLNDRSEPKVAVLMAVFRNARFLPEQLASVHMQDHRNRVLWVSRDCDDEEVGRALAKYGKVFEAGCFVLRSGPRRGAAANFLSLLFDPGIEADHFAYADQDDIWETDRLSRAIAWLERIPANVPALHCSRSCLVDEDGRDLGLSPFHGVRTPGFRNALVQNIASGHSMTMNRAACDLLRASGIAEVPFHDWWTYLLVAGAGGHIRYDPNPCVRHRQHEHNLTGMPVSFGGRMRRAAVGGRKTETVAATLRALHRAAHLLTPENRRILAAYGRALERRLPLKLWGMASLGLYRQARFGRLWALLDASLCGRKAVQSDSRG